MSCQNCFNGCTDIISDKCVKYTGVPIPELGIDTGDSLLVVENQIVEHLLSVMIGEGVIPIIDPSDLCPLVEGFLPVSGEITLNDVISALIQSICDINFRLDALKDRVIVLEDVIVILNGPYDIDCLTGVTPTDGTHAILQAVITKLCAVALDLETNYVLISEIDNLIASYLASLPSTDLFNNKMVPYTAIPYFGPTLGNFDITGAGLGDWVKIYLCNGQNGTPDLRGRTLVGATTMGTNPFNPAVDPAIAGNPTYNNTTETGANVVTLIPNNIPPHSHTATATVTDPGHVHDIYTNESNDGDNNNQVQGGIYEFPTASPGQIISNTTGITVAVAIGIFGPGTPHANVQPGRGTNFIMYIP